MLYVHEQILDAFDDGDDVEGGAVSAVREQPQEVAPCPAPCPPLLPLHQGDTRHLGRGCSCWCWRRRQEEDAVQGMRRRLAARNCVIIVSVAPIMGTNAVWAWAGTRPLTAFLSSAANRLIGLVSIVSYSRPSVMIMRQHPNFT